MSDTGINFAKINHEFYREPLCRFGHCGFIFTYLQYAVLNKYLQSFSNIIRTMYTSLG